MRVLIAPGPFGGGLGAVAAAAAIAEGWSRRAPQDDLVLAPVSDGGEGYVDVLHACLGGDLVRSTVPDAHGRPTAAIVLLVERTAYVETSQVVGANIVAGDDPERASSFGVGLLVADAVAAGAERVVVGVGATGVATNDGGAGLLAGLGATSAPPDALRDGSRGLDALTRVDLAPALLLTGRTRLTLATDDEVPLLGPLGTTNTAGPGRGIRADRLPIVDSRLERLADEVGRRHALASPAGAGGGIGFALLCVGAAKLPGLGSVLDEIALAASAARADLVVTGERAFDLSAGSGLIVTGVAVVAGSVVRPCIALADRVLVGARETRALGLESAYSVRDLVGDSGTGEPAGDVAAAAERVARTWSWAH